jgi:tetratricopeptide (TPR) repeat protein
MNRLPDLLPETDAGPQPPALGSGLQAAPQRVALDDPRVIQAVEEYQAAWEAGPRPDRQAFLAGHLDIAAVLAQCLDGLEFVHSAAPQLSQSSQGQPSAAVAEIQPEGPLGDFRIVREIGRGGMAVVYEAMQISLGRRVALKVLPFASTLDARQLQRFKNEAQAAAGLHHTNIVPVFATGCERGVHYYAMQFIDGQTVAALISGLRAGPTTSPVSPADEPTGPDLPTPPVAVASTQPTVREPAFFRMVATLGIQAAEALEHAHQLGIIHRDIKPANLLVENDAPLAPAGHGVAGEGVRLWITDFGLAHCQSQSGLTMTGDLVGTLRYMSPEQALAKRVVVDQRTDVYSLGVTLYELLTLEPAFPGSDRQELLRQIAFEEPRTPRRINKAIPVELETIVLKAMEKNPAERYGTAQELADDLERWLKDEPIRARRPTVVQRLRRWSRRHKPVVAGLAAGLLTLLVVGTVLAFAYQRRLAETERGVTAALTKAEMLLVEGDKQINHPERWLAATLLAQSAQDKAEELLAAGARTDELTKRVRQVRAAVEVAVSESRLMVELERIRLEQAAVVKEEHFDYARAAPLYAKLLGDYGVDLAAPEAAAARVQASRLREALLAALHHWARVTGDAGERQQLEAVLQAAEPADAFRMRWRAAARRKDGAALVQLATEPQVQQLPAADIAHLGQDLADMKEWAAAERLLRAAQERKPADFWLNHNLGLVLQAQGLSRAEEAVGYLRVALALRSDSPGVYLNLSNALAARGDLDGALRCLQAALQIDPNYATGHKNRGVALHKKGRLDHAIAEYQEAIRLNKDDADAYNDLGNALCEQGMLNEGIAAYRKAIAIKQDFEGARLNLGTTLLEEKGLPDEAAAEYEKVLVINKDCAEAHHGLGRAFAVQGKLDEAISAYRKAIAIKKDYFEAHNSLGIALRDKGQLDEAITEFQEAVAIKKDNVIAQCNLGAALIDKGQLDEAIAACQKASTLQPDYAEAYSVLGAALCERGNVWGAIAACQKAIALQPDHAEAHRNLGNALMAKDDLPGAIAAFREAIRLKKDDAQAHNHLGIALDRQGKPDEAITQYQEALAIKRDYAEAHYNLGIALKDKGQLDEAIAAYQDAIRFKPNFDVAHNNLGAILCDHKHDYDGAIAAFLEAIRHKPEDPEYHYNLGNALSGKGRLDEAIAEYQKAIRIKKDFASAHYLLGNALGQQGKFLQAVEELRLGHELGSRNPSWRDPSARWLRDAEQLAVLDARLPQFLTGEAQPADGAERALLCWLCQQPYKQLHAAAARFYAEAFAAQPKLAENLRSADRYNAACAAALAGCGQGKDADQLDDRERVRLRRQALTWLRADLAAWRKHLEPDEAKGGSDVRETMQHWLADPDFAGVRDPEALAKLPEAEQNDWRKLWADVQDLWTRTAGDSPRKVK